MDILKIPPRLIFKEREHLEDFGIGTEGTVGDQIYKCLKKRQWIPWANLLIDDDLRLFNEANYLCAVIFRLEKPEGFLEEWRTRPVYNSFLLIPDKSTKNTVLGMVYAYLECLNPVLEGYKTLISANYAKAFIAYILRKCHWLGLPRLFGYADPIRFLSLEVKGEIQASEIDFRKPSDHEYNLIDWMKLTDGYKPDEVFQMISFLGRRFEDRLGFIDIIINSAERDLIKFKVSQDTLKQLSDMKEKISKELVYKDEDTILDSYRAIIEGRASSLEPETSEQNEQKTAKEPEPEDESIPHFPLIGNRKKGSELYEDLIVKGFINRDTKKDCWLYVMGFSTEKPEEFKPIDWLVSKELARSLIEKVYDGVRKEGIVTLARLEELVKICFIRRGQPLKLNSRKPYTSDMSDKLDKILKDFSDLS